MPNHYGKFQYQALRPNHKTLLLTYYTGKVEQFRPGVVVQHVVGKSETTDTGNNQPTPLRQRSARSSKNIAGIHENKLGLS